MDSSDWTRPGASLSDKSARTEFDLTQHEIIQGINDGKLQYREGNMNGNPWYRLLRSEVEALVREIRGENYLKLKFVQNELAGVEGNLRKAKAQVTSLSARRAELLAILESMESGERKSADTTRQ